MSPRISIRLLSAQSDQRLAGLAGEGHERAFEALVHRYRRQLLRYCRGMRLSDARAEDVLQQAFLQAWMAFARGTEVRDVRPWLYRIVHNAAINAMRGAADDHSELTEAMQAKAALAGESELQRKMAVHEALTDMAALPQMQQQAIFLTAVDGQSHDEVASVLGISEGALRGLLYRARASLRSAAAALTPPPLLEWAARGADTAGPTAERIAELSSGGAAAGVTGLLLKGAVVAVTAGAVATGASVVHGPGDRPAAHRTSSAAPAPSTAKRQPAARAVALVSPSSLRISRGEQAGRAHQNGRAGRREGTGDGSAAGHRDRSSSAEDNRGKSLRSDGSGKEGPEQGASRSGPSDPSDTKGGGSGSADGGGGSASSGSASATSGRDREASPTDGGAQPAATSGASSGGGSGASSGTGEGTAATASLITGDASGPDDPAQAGVSGTRDG
jgi:RNA polymerase sigma factor (sigma-70 family)